MTVACHSFTCVDSWYCTRYFVLSVDGFLLEVKARSMLCLLDIQVRRRYSIAAGKWLLLMGTGSMQVERFEDMCGLW